MWICLSFVVCAGVIYALHRPVTSPRLCIRLQFLRENNRHTKRRRWFAWSESFYVSVQTIAVYTLYVRVVFSPLLFSRNSSFQEERCVSSTKTPCFCIPKPFIYYSTNCWNEEWVQERARALAHVAKSAITLCLQWCNEVERNASYHILF